MKTLIHICVIVTLAFITILLAVFAINAESRINLYMAAMIAGLSVTIFLLYRLDKKRVETASAKLELAIQQKTREYVDTNKPYEYRAGLKTYLFLIVMVLLGGGLVWFGYANWHWYGYWNKKLFISSLCLGLGGLFIILALLQMKRLLVSPVIRFDTQALSHYVFGHIEWKEICRSHLIKLEIKSSKQFRLIVEVKQPEPYIAKFSWLQRRFFNLNKGNLLELHLPVPEADAHVIGTLAEKYIKKYGATPPETKMDEAHRLLREVQALMDAPQTAENTEKLNLALQHSLANAQAISAELGAGSRKIRNINLLVVLAVVAYIAYLYLKLSRI